MAVVGEMHVGKGKEEKEKRKGRGRQLVRARARPRRRDAHGSPISRATLRCVACEMRTPRASRVRHALRRAYRTKRCCLLLLPLGARRTKRQCVLLP